MKILRIAIVALSCFIAGCSEKRPVHPNVGLRVYSNGHEEVKCGLFMTEQAEQSPGVEVKLTPKSMRFASGGHEVSVQWEPDLGGAEDHYDLIITSDQVTTRRRVAYRGQSIVLVEQPFRVVMEDVNFGTIKAERTVPSDVDNPSN